MEWLTQFQGCIVGLDTAPLIYFIEQNPRYLEIVRAFFIAIERAEFQVVTSTLTLTEVLVYPLKAKNERLAKNFSLFLRFLVKHFASYPTNQSNSPIVFEVSSRLSPAR